MVKKEAEAYTKRAEEGCGGGGLSCYRTFANHPDTIYFVETTHNHIDPTVPGPPAAAVHELKETYAALTPHTVAWDGPFEDQAALWVALKEAVKSRAGVQSGVSSEYAWI